MLEIPIYKPTGDEVNKIAALVEKIIIQKSMDKDSSENEKKIDELVYKLYDLNKEEINVFENALLKLGNVAHLNKVVK